MSFTPYQNNTILLHLASQKGHHYAVQKLLKSGANVNIATSNVSCLGGRGGGGGVIMTCGRRYSIMHCGEEVELLKAKLVVWVCLCAVLAMAHHVCCGNIVNTCMYVICQYMF